MIVDAGEERERHGYEIGKLIDDRSGGKLRFHVASLYPMLYRMERRDWIEGKWIEKADQQLASLLTPREPEIVEDSRSISNRFLQIP